MLNEDDHLQFVLAQFFHSEEGFVFPGNQHIANPSLHKRSSRTARS